MGALAEFGSKVGNGAKGLFASAKSNAMKAPGNAMDAASASWSLAKHMGIGAGIGGVANAAAYANNVDITQSGTIGQAFMSGAMLGGVAGAFTGAAAFKGNMKAARGERVMGKRAATRGRFGKIAHANSDMSTSTVNNVDYSIPAYQRAGKAINNQEMVGPPRPTAFDNMGGKPANIGSIAAGINYSKVGVGGMPTEQMGLAF